MLFAADCSTCSRIASIQIYICSAGMCTRAIIYENMQEYTESYFPLFATSFHFNVGNGYGNTIEMRRTAAAQVGLRALQI